MSLSHLPDRFRVVVFVGSGGVGKTTSTAAFGLRAAMEGKRVLCLTVDPARRLANSLGLDRMHADEQPIPPALFEEHRIECTGSVSAMMLDTKRTFDDLVTRHASSPEARERILQNEIYRYVSTLSGTSEYMAMEKLHAVREEGRWDLIVLDTPPTSNALDFLNAPDRMIELIDSPAMRWFIQAFEKKGKLSLNLVGKSAAFLLRALARFTGAEFLAQVAEFVSELNELFGGFRDRATAVAEALRGPDVAFVVVTSPSPLAVDEALFLHRRLGELGMKTHGFVINRVHAMAREPQATTRELEAEAAAHLPEGVDPKRAVQKLRRAMDDHRVRAQADQREVKRLRDLVGPDTPCIEVPAFEQDVHDLSALAKVGHFLTGVDSKGPEA